MPAMSQSKDSKRTQHKAEAKPVQQSGPAAGSDASLEQVKKKDQRDDAMAKANAFAAQVNAILAEQGKGEHLKPQWRHGEVLYELCTSTTIEHDLSDDRIKELTKPDPNE